MDRALIKLYAGILKDKLEVHKQYTFNNEIYILLDAPIRGGERMNKDLFDLYLYILNDKYSVVSAYSIENCYFIKVFIYIYIQTMIWLSRIITFLYLVPK